LEKAKKLSPASTRILLTGYTDVESIVDAINRGNIYRYVAKPWDPKDLQLTLKQANESYRLRQELEEKNRALVKANEELKNALEGLKLLDRAKARFLSLVSHELNTPLTVLSSFVQLLEQTKTALPGEVQKAISSISNASLRFSEIVGEVITYVRLESGQTLASESIDFQAEADRLLKEMKAALAKKNLNGIVRGSGTGKGDLEKMKLALQKVFADAIERAKPQTDLIIDIQKKDVGIEFSLLRSGDPLPEIAFQPLEAGGTVLHHHKNLGLALAICKLIVESHGGKIVGGKEQGMEKLTFIFPAP
jgi:signal transduction histidine kinase